MKTKPAIVAALFAAFAAAAPNAFAQAKASASVTQFRYQLIDLDPNDGIAPSIVFSRRGVLVEGALFDNPTFEPPPAVFDSRDTEGTISLSTPEGFGNATAGQFTVSSEVNMHANSGVSDAVTAWDFILSANTQLVFAAFVSLDVVADPFGGGAFGEAGLFGGLLGSPDNISINFSSDIYSLGGHIDQFVLASAYTQGSSMAGWMQLQSVTQAQSFAPPVPEPGHAGMLAGGLALLGATMRRRVRRGKGMALQR